MEPSRVMNSVLAQHRERIEIVSGQIQIWKTK